MDARETLDYIATNRPVLLEDLHRRQTVVRDYVRGVARHYSTGLYLFGRPGTAKTHTVCDVLDREIGDLYRYQRGHLTPVGLFELIAEHPDEVIVLDDLVSIFRSDVALQVLLSALEHPKSSDRGRVVRYRSKGNEERVVFRGGIICISNRELHDEDMLGAFKSRVHTLNYNPSDAQLGALMLDIADRGWPAKGPQAVKPEEASEVAQFVIGELLRLSCRFDIRLFVDKALPDYRQWKEGEAESDWRDLVAASIEQHLVARRKPDDRAPSRADRKEEEHAIVRAILNAHQGPGGPASGLVRDRTGKSARAFYRRWGEIA